jgi:hypothetical protein
MIKKLLPILLLSLFPFLGKTQTFVIPQEPELIDAEEYSAYEEDIQNGISWALKTAPNKAIEKQKKFGAFFMKWIEGTPAVTIELDANMVPFIEDHPTFLLIFMYGWTQASLKEEGKLSPEDGNFYGLKAVAEYYVDHQQLIGKDANLKKVAKLHQKNTLRKYIKKKLAN